MRAFPSDDHDGDVDLAYSVAVDVMKELFGRFDDASPESRHALAYCVGKVIMGLVGRPPRWSRLACNVIAAELAGRFHGREPVEKIVDEAPPPRCAVVSIAAARRHPGRL